MLIDKPLRRESLIPTQRHFQQQERWTEFTLRRFTTAAFARQIPLPTSVADVSPERHAVPRS